MPRTSAFRTHTRWMVCGPALAAVGLLFLTAGAVVACTGPGVSVAEAGQASTLIVLADVVTERENGLSYDLRVVAVARGKAVVGDTITVGAGSGVATGFPDCWLRLPVGKEVVLALPDPSSLYALTSYGWWEENGHVSSPSPIDDDWPDSMPDLYALLAGMPPTDTQFPPEDSGREGVALLLIACLLGFLTVLNLVRRRVEADR